MGLFSKKPKSSFPAMPPKPLDAKWKYTKPYETYQEAEKMNGVLPFICNEISETLGCDSDGVILNALKAKNLSYDTLEGKAEFFRQAMKEFDSTMQRSYISKVVDVRANPKTNSIDFLDFHKHPEYGFNQPVSLIVSAKVNPETGKFTGEIHVEDGANYEILPNGNVICAECDLTVKGNKKNAYMGENVGTTAVYEVTGMFGSTGTPQAGILIEGNEKDIQKTVQIGKSNHASFELIFGDKNNDMNFVINTFLIPQVAFEVTGFNYGKEKAINDAMKEAKWREMKELTGTDLSKQMAYTQEANDRYLKTEAKCKEHMYKVIDDMYPDGKGFLPEEKTSAESINSHLNSHRELSKEELEKAKEMFAEMVRTNAQRGK